VKIEA